MNDPARAASTVCLVRDGDDGLEVLMVRRTPRAQFMGGAWVFPGGAVDAGDASVLASSAVRSGDRELFPWRAAALRELVEETSIWVRERGIETGQTATRGDDVFAASSTSGGRLDGDALRYFANWVTPSPLPIRFDTRFFAVDTPGDVDPLIDGDELVGWEWVPPARALDRSVEGSWTVAFPTRKTLEWLDAFATKGGLFSHIERMSEVAAVRPRLSVRSGIVEVLVPGDPGFEDAEEGERDPILLSRIVEAIDAGGAVPPEFR